MSEIRLHISLTGNAPDYEAAMSRFIAQAAQKVRRRMREKMTEQKSGRLYARKRGEGFSRSHRASAKGEAPASDSGRMSRSLEVIKKSSLEAMITTDLGYPVILETEKNRPLWQATLDEMLPVLENDLVRAFQ